MSMMSYILQKKASLCQYEFQKSNHPRRTYVATSFLLLLLPLRLERIREQKLHDDV